MAFHTSPPANVAAEGQPRRRPRSPRRADSVFYSSATPSQTESSGAARPLDGRSSTSDVGTWESSRTDDETIGNVWDSRSTAPYGVPESERSSVPRIPSSPAFSFAAKADAPALAEIPKTEDNETAPQARQTHVSQPQYPLPVEANAEFSDLLKFYFYNLCRKNSVFDGPANPFRYMIIQWLTDSPLILNCVLSMSARALVGHRPDILPKAVRHHTVAVGYLTEILTKLTHQTPSDPVDPSIPAGEDSAHQIKQAVLASILLGISSSWLDASDLGVQHLLGARKLLSQWQTMGTTEANRNHWVPSIAMQDPEKSFIIGALAYWEALIAFVIDQPLNAVDYLEQFCDQSSLEMIYLNGWTGICTPLFVYLAKVAILVRQKRQCSKMANMGWNSSLENVRSKLLGTAIELERLIVAYNLPPRSKLFETGDPLVSLSQLEALAHCYQLTSLLELYRSFPEILTQKTYTYCSAGSVSGSIWAAAADSSPTIGGMQPLTQLLVQGTEHSSRSLLFNMATTVIGMMEGVPEGSGLSYIHTLGMIICGSTLSALPEHTCLAVKEQGPQGLLMSIAMDRANVVKTRDAVLKRLRANAKAAGMDSFCQVEVLLKEVWGRLDAISDQLHPVVGDDAEKMEQVHWLDVMIECRLESVYG
ncbi:uncharacterized protein A1O9_02351 [Exophiala aquamarina CBS 119918]|uniref:Transcription factor domain-containing protein n=1 Tax=Exophiala aquamarina CBS 119918 TaxID=1182545 RepID=A0A072PL54_9EURO|nr:uncharacterized protein A1O9_02351 [Exophiala aquamarina CBS 119918]KEF60789.1 hypothetical protein A1O9_02351 [Exophiala aquamarina CBS 119918]